MSHVLKFIIFTLAAAGCMLRMHTEEAQLCSLPASGDSDVVVYLWKTLQNTLRQLKAMPGL